MTKLSKIFHFLLPYLFLAACFQAGYWIGKNPELYEKIDLTETEVYFFLEDTSLLSAENRERLSTLSGTRIHFNEKEKSDSDLIFVQSPNLMKEWPASNKLKSFNKIKLSYKKISTDFLFKNYEALKVFPLLWRTLDQKSLEISAAQLMPNSVIKKSAVLRILETLTSKDFQEKWIPQIQWNTTVLGLNTSIIPENKRPESLRTSNLTHLQIKK